MSVLEEIKSLVAVNLGVEEERVHASSNLATDLGADSLDAVELIMEIEDHFDISVSEEDALKLLTIQDIVDYIEK